MSSHYGGSHYASSSFLSSHYGRTEIVPPIVEPVHPTGTGEDAEARWRRIQIEDELILLVIQAWLSMKDR